MAAAADHMASHQALWAVAVAAAAAAVAAVVDRFTVAHPYLLADNRSSCLLFASRGRTHFAPSI